MVPFMKNTDGAIAVIACDSTDLSTMLRDSEGFSSFIMESWR